MTDEPSTSEAQQNKATNERTSPSPTTTPPPSTPPPESPDEASAEKNENVSIPENADEGADDDDDDDDDENDDDENDDDSIVQAEPESSIQVPAPVDDTPKPVEEARHPISRVSTVQPISRSVQPDVVPDTDPAFIVMDTKGEGERPIDVDCIERDTSVGKAEEGVVVEGDVSAEEEHAPELIDLTVSPTQKTVRSPSIAENSQSEEIQEPDVAGLKARKDSVGLSDEEIDEDEQEVVEDGKESLDAPLDVVNSLEDREKPAVHSRDSGDEKEHGMMDVIDSESTKHQEGDVMETMDDTHERMEEEEDEGKKIHVDGSSSELVSPSDAAEKEPADDNMRDIDISVDTSDNQKLIVDEFSNDDEKDMGIKSPSPESQGEDIKMADEEEDIMKESSEPVQDDVASAPQEVTISNGDVGPNTPSIVPQLHDGREKPQQSAETPTLVGNGDVANTILTPNETVTLLDSNERPHVSSNESAATDTAVIVKVSPEKSSLPIKDEGINSSEGLDSQGTKTLESLARESSKEAVREMLSSAQEKVVHPGPGIPAQGATHAGQADVLPARTNPTAYIPPQKPLKAVLSKETRDGLAHSKEASGRAVESVCQADKAPNISTKHGDSPSKLAVQSTAEVALQKELRDGPKEDGDASQRTSERDRQADQADKILDKTHGSSSNVSTQMPSEIMSSKKPQVENIETKEISPASLATPGNLTAPMFGIHAKPSGTGMVSFSSPPSFKTPKLSPNAAPFVPGSAFEMSVPQTVASPESSHIAPLKVQKQTIETPKKQLLKPVTKMVMFADTPKEIAKVKQDTTSVIPEAKVAKAQEHVEDKQKLLKVRTDEGLRLEVSHVTMSVRVGNGKVMKRETKSTVRLTVMEGNGAKLEFFKGTGPSMALWESLSPPKDHLRIRKVTNQPYVMTVSRLGPATNSEKPEVFSKFFLHFEEDTFNPIFVACAEHLQVKEPGKVSARTSAPMATPRPVKRSGSDPVVAQPSGVKRIAEPVKHMTSVKKPKTEIDKKSQLLADRNKLLQDKIAALKRKSGHGAPTGGSSSKGSSSGSQTGGVQLRGLGVLAGVRSGTKNRRPGAISGSKTSPSSAGGLVSHLASQSAARINVALESKKTISVSNETISGVKKTSLGNRALEERAGPANIKVQNASAESQTTAPVNAAAAMVDIPSKVDGTLDMKHNKSSGTVAPPIKDSENSTMVDSAEAGTNASMKVGASLGSSMISNKVTKEKASGMNVALSTAMKGKTGLGVKSVPMKRTVKKGFLSGTLQETGGNKVSGGQQMRRPIVTQKPQELSDVFGSSSTKERKDGAAGPIKKNKAKTGVALKLTVPTPDDSTRRDIEMAEAKSAEMAVLKHELFEEQEKRRKTNDELIEERKARKMERLEIMQSLERISSLLQELKKQSSKVQEGYYGPKEVIENCDVASVEGFFERLHSFSPLRWAGFEETGIDAVECALRGWYNSGDGTIRSSEGAEIKLRRSCEEDDVAWSEEVERVKGLLHSGHKLMSKWKGQQCDEGFRGIEGSGCLLSKEDLLQKIAGLKEAGIDLGENKMEIGSDKVLGSADMCARMAAFHWGVEDGDLGCQWCGRKFFIGEEGFELFNGHYEFCAMRRDDWAVVVRRNGALLGIGLPSEGDTDKTTEKGNEETAEESLEGKKVEGENKRNEDMKKGDNEVEKGEKGEEGVKGEKGKNGVKGDEGDKGDVEMTD